MGILGGIFSAANPYGLWIKLGLGLAALLALLGLVWSWHSRGQQIDALESWQTTVVLAATDATVEPGADGKRKTLKPEQVPSAISALKSSLDSANTALDQITLQANTAKTRADAADKALAAQTADFDRRYATASRRIDVLQARKPAATPAESCAAQSEDSKTAWEGWK